MDYVILRCRNSNTLAQVKDLRERAVLLGIESSDIVCPTYMVAVRIGGQRDRVEHEVPILGSFIFARWPGHTYWINYLEGSFPFIKAMRKPTGGFACCSTEDIALINTIAPLPLPDADAIPLFSIGSRVKVIEGFLKNITGHVLRYRPDGRVLLKVIDNKGWKLSTLLISAAVLALDSAPV